MSSIGILAYGSLIGHPGKEIEPLIRERRLKVKTPFCIEFARKSKKRSDAPTVIPVESGGCSVLATILVLDAGISLEKAEDLLWRRETGNECSDRHYNQPAQSNNNPNKMVVERLRNFEGIGLVLYTKLGANITDISPSKLADLAIASVKAEAEAGKTGEDGISYLISLKQQGILTPMMPDYENEILKKTGTSSLEKALDMLSG